MIIEWLGHACFLLQTDKGTKIVTDPYEPGSYGGAVAYSEIGVDADIVTVSHKHFDHAYTKIFTSAQIVDKPTKYNIKDVVIEGLLSYHDKRKGADRGENIIFIISVDGLKIAHFGDLGDIPQDIERLKDLDVALIPTGGTFTLGPQEAKELVEKITPRIVIPMHFKTEKLGFDIEGVESFLKGFSNVERANTSLLEVKKENLPQGPKIIVLKHSR